MTLPGPDVTHRWQGRTLVDHHGEPLGTIEIIYLDKVTNQPEWALLEAGGTGPTRTFIPLVSAGEEGDTVRVPFAKTLVEGAPAMAADQELSEDQEGELYRHYGVPYSRADSPSGLPAGEPEPTESALAAGGPQPAEAPVSPSTLGVAAGEPEVTAEEPTTAAEEPLPADGRARPEAAAPEPAPIPTSAVAPAPGRVDATVSEASATDEGLVATRPLQVTNARVGAGVAALALAVGIWRRRTIGRQLGAAVGRLGTVPATISRQRRRRRRAKALNQAVTAATQQTTALARGTARLVTGTALLPVTVAVAGGRGVRAAGQATGKAISQGARRVRPGRRRKRRGGTLGMAVGGAAGYVLGAKAGRERYEELAASAKRWRQRPEVKRLGEQAVARLDRLSDQAADKLQAARQSTGAETSSSGGPPATVGPETPTVTPPAPTVVPPVDLAPMPAAPPVLPGEDASAAEERQRPAPPDPLP
jgi:hypothetical protein